MPDPITYAEAAALAQRLDRAREQGALLVIMGVVVTGFHYWPEAQQIDAAMTGNWCQPFYRAHWLMSPAKFEAHHQKYITVTYPGPWPTGEAVTADEARDIIRLVGINIASWLDGQVNLAFLMQNAECLAQVCRALATETGENAGG